MIPPSLYQINEELSVPFEKALGELLEHLDGDAVSKSTFISAFVLSLWQERTRGKIRQPPSIVLVSAENINPDPIRSTLELLLHKLKEPAPVEGLRDFYTEYTDEEKCQAMLDAVLNQAKHLKTYPTHPIEGCELAFNRARLSRYGEGDHSNYAKAWHPKLGLMTDKTDATILHINKKDDKAAFRRDVMEAPLNILQAAGPGKGLDIFYKSIALSGSLSAAELDDNFIDAILNLGMPFFILPHTNKEPLTLPNLPALKALTGFIAKEVQIPMHTPTQMQNDTWSITYQNILWKRLSYLPANYRFPILEHVHKLAGVCQNIAVFVGKLDDVKDATITQIAAELYIHTLRGITLGIVSFAWYGLGFDLGCPLRQARKLLKKLREEGAMSRRSVQRAVAFKSAELRDDVLHRLAGEGLIIINGKDVAPVSYPDFISWLYTRSDFPLPKLILPQATT